MMCWAGGRTLANWAVWALSCIAQRRSYTGFTGRAVMELGNIGPMPVALYPGMRICVH